SALAFQASLSDGGQIVATLERSDLQENVTAYAAQISGGTRPIIVQFENASELKVKELKVKEPKVKEPKVKEPKVKELKVKELKVKELKVNASLHGLCYSVSLLLRDGPDGWSKPIRTIPVLTTCTSGTTESLQRPAWCSSCSHQGAACSARQHQLQRGAEPRYMLYKDFHKGKTVFRHWLPGVCYRNITFMLISEATISQHALLSHSDVTHTPLHHRTVPFPPLNISHKIVHLVQRPLQKDPPAPPGGPGTLPSWTKSPWRRLDEHEGTEAPFSFSPTHNLTGFNLTNEEDEGAWLNPPNEGAYDGFNIYIYRDGNSTETASVDENTHEFFTELMEPGTYRVLVKTLSSAGDCEPRESAANTQFTFYLSASGVVLEDLSERPQAVGVRLLDSSTAAVSWSDSSEKHNGSLVSVISTTCRRPSISQRMENTYCEQENSSSDLITNLTPGAQYRVVVYHTNGPLLSPPSEPVIIDIEPTGPHPLSPLPLSLTLSPPQPDPLSPLSPSASPSLPLSLTLSPPQPHPLSPSPLRAHGGGQLSVFPSASPSLPLSPSASSSLPLSPSASPSLPLSPSASSSLPLSPSASPSLPLSPSEPTGVQQLSVFPSASSSLPPLPLSLTLSPPQSPQGCISFRCSPSPPQPHPLSPSASPSLPLRTHGGASALCVPPQPHPPSPSPLQSPRGCISFRCSPSPPQPHPLSPSPPQPHPLSPSEPTGVHQLSVFPLSPSASPSLPLSLTLSPPQNPRGCISSLCSPQPHLPPPLPSEPTGVHQLSVFPSPPQPHPLSPLPSLTLSPPQSPRGCISSLCSPSASPSLPLRAHGAVLLSWQRPYLVSFRKFILQTFFFNPVTLASEWTVYYEIAATSSRVTDLLPAWYYNFRVSMVTWGDPPLSCCDRSTVSFITAPEAPHISSVDYSHGVLYVRWTYGELFIDLSHSRMLHWTLLAVGKKGSERRFSIDVTRNVMFAGLPLPPGDIYNLTVTACTERSRNTSIPHIIKLEPAAPLSLMAVNASHRVLYYLCVSVEPAAPLSDGSEHLSQSSSRLLLSLMAVNASHRVLYYLCVSVEPAAPLSDGKPAAPLSLMAVNASHRVLYYLCVSVEPAAPLSLMALNASHRSRLLLSLMAVNASHRVLYYLCVSVEPAAPLSDGKPAAPLSLMAVNASPRVLYYLCVSVEPAAPVSLMAVNASHRVLYYLCVSVEPAAPLSLMAVNASHRVLYYLCVSVEPAAPLSDGKLAAPLSLMALNASHRVLYYLCVSVEPAAPLSLMAVNASHRVLYYLCVSVEPAAPLSLMASWLLLSLMALNPSHRVLYYLCVSVEPAAPLSLMASWQLLSLMAVNASHRVLYYLCVSVEPAAPLSLMAVNASHRVLAGSSSLSDGSERLSQSSVLSLCFCRAGCSSLSDGKPAAPRSLMAVNASHSSVSLLWTQDGVVDFYQILCRDPMPERETKAKKPLCLPYPPAVLPLD
ncbi:Receptor-type tyrosine-protein phosphatase O, partial [Dissostichus eleginoides]